MKILICLTYYSPHKSGLTVYVERLAAALACTGDDVTILTSQHKADLPKMEVRNGVKIVRLPVWLRLSKGVIMPGIIIKAWRLIHGVDVVNLHLPQFEGAYIAIVAKLLGKSLVVTHHSDLTMPAGWLNQIAASVTKLANRIAASLADVVVHNTLDFAQHSYFLRRFEKKLQIISPPIVVEEVSQAQIDAFIDRNDIRDEQIIIGMAARLATEKGVEYLVSALSEILAEKENARVLFAGEYQHVIGEEQYMTKIMLEIKELGKHWTFLGVDSPQDRTAFYKCCDVLVLPSINNTESFGMVQVEALMCGVPVIATDLPGVRQPAIQSGFGAIIPIRDSHALAQAILAIIAQFTQKVDASRYTQAFTPEKVAEAYRILFMALTKVKPQQKD